MGLIEVLSRAASSRAHVLIAEAPGAFRQRVALERALDRRGWCGAESVADADVLAVVGEPAEALADVVEHVWGQMSEPRARIHVRDEAVVDELLTVAAEQLRGTTGRIAESELRLGFTPSADDLTHEMSGDHGDHGGQDMAGGHDHAAMMPDGISLAEGAEDRDGLEMDELHLPLGPVLAHWPAGLVLRVTLHGDVVVDATVEQLTDQAGPPPAADDMTTRAARLLDAAGSVLTLAGLPAESARARRLRDRCLDGDVTSGRDVTTLGERIARRRSLRWVLGGLTATGSHGGAERLQDRLVGLFEQAGAALDGEEPLPSIGPGALPELVRGQELAAVRLWVAALMPALADDRGSVAHD